MARCEFLGREYAKVSICPPTPLAWVVRIVPSGGGRTISIYGACVEAVECGSKVHEDSFQHPRSEMLMICPADQILLLRAREVTTRDLTERARKMAHAPPDTCTV